MALRRVLLGGRDLTVLEAGPGGAPLLMVHGFTGRKEDFADWVQPLADAGHHVVVPDLRGHGASDKPDGTEHYSLALFAADVVALADAMSFERFALVGHSMGGMVAQRLALGHPDRLDALVLMDTHHGPLTTVDPALVDLGVMVALTEGMDAVADAVAAMGTDGPLATPAWEALQARRPELAAEVDANLRACAPSMYAAMLRELTARPDELDLLAALSVPTLVVVGEHDTPFLAASGAMAATIPGARLATVAGGGHSPQLEAPQAWWEAVSDFLVASPVPVSGTCRGTAPGPPAPG